MKCPQCQNEQSSGNFCGVCGSALSGEVVASQSTALVTVEQGSKDSAGKMKMYWDNSLLFLKQPLEAFRVSESGFAQGVATLLLYTLAFSLSIYFLANSLIKVMTFGFGEPERLPFFETSSKIFIYSFVGVVLSLAAIMIVSKLMKLTLNDREIVAQYGALITPFFLVNLIAVLFALSGTVTATLVLLGASLSYALYFVPVLFIFNHGFNSQSRSYAFYGAVGTSIIISFLTYFFWKWMLIEKIDQIDSFFSGFYF
ncbi:zinc ribbon domain-containing protein [Halobacillus sp. Marseille-Q1614]|uniref:zinc ribbon domain-containing protein n=1 Tax=Halobacillus sp. Marseille-Q1614 TaxID=2709134 RepID=UPI00157159B8|nr:zinc ribbon domain-containing protein [Halobacillus sp. Marseille-Q1614]